MSLVATAKAAARATLTRRAATLATVALAPTAFAPTARAATWDYQPRVEVGATYVDNYRLSELASDKVSVAGPLVDAELGIHSLTPRSDLAIIPRVHSTFFPSHTSDQSTDGFVTIEGNYRTQRSALGGVAQYSDETVVSSELLPAAFPGVPLGQTVGGDSGRVTFHNRRRFARFAPTWRYDWDQRHRLHFDGEYSDIKYNHSGIFQQVGFRNAFASAGVELVLSQRSSLTVRGIGARFEPDTGGNNTNHYGLQMEWNTRRSDIARVYLRLGADRTAAQTGTGTASSTGVVGGAGVRWTYPITEFILDALRSLEPSSAGAVLTRNELRFRMNHAFRPRWKGFVALRGVHVTGTAQQAIVVQNRDYATGTAGFEWQMSRSYRLQATYDYTWQRFQGEPTASSNGVVVSVIWEPQSKFMPQAPAYAPY